MPDYSVKACFKTSCLNGGAAILDRPFLTLCAYAALVISSVLSMKLQTTSLLHSGHLPGRFNTSANHSVNAFVFGIIHFSAIIFLSFNAMRYTFFQGRTTVSVNVPFRRYFRLTFGLGVLGALFLLLNAIVLITLFILSLKYHVFRLDRAQLMAALMTYAVLLICCFIYLTTRLSLLLCNRALGGRALWREGWQATRGHFWALWGTHLLTTLPVCVFWAICTAIPLSLRRNMSPDGWPIAFSAIQSIFWVLYTAISASATAWLYRRFGASPGMMVLPQEPEPAPDGAR